MTQKETITQLRKLAQAKLELLFTNDVDKRACIYEVTLRNYRNVDEMENLEQLREVNHWLIDLFV